MNLHCEYYNLGFLAWELKLFDVAVNNFQMQYILIICSMKLIILEEFAMKHWEI